MPWGLQSKLAPASQCREMWELAICSILAQALWQQEQFSWKHDFLCHFADCRPLLVVIADGGRQLWQKHGCRSKKGWGCQEGEQVEFSAGDTACQSRPGGAGEGLGAEEGDLTSLTGSICDPHFRAPSHNYQAWAQASCVFVKC